MRKLSIFKKGRMKEGLEISGENFNNIKGDRCVYLCETKPLLGLAGVLLF